MCEGINDNIRCIVIGIGDNGSRCVCVCVRGGGDAVQCSSRSSICACMQERGRRDLEEKGKSDDDNKETTRRRGAMCARGCAARG